MGKLITTCERIVELATEKKAIYNKLWDKHTSAAFFLGMPLRIITMYLKSKALFEYEP